MLSGRCLMGLPLSGLLVALVSATAHADDTPDAGGAPDHATALLPAPASPSAATEAKAPAPGAKSGGPSDDTAASPPAGHNGQFEFGSYGRVQVGSDLRGGTGRPANIVAYGTRIDEDSYAELELRREDAFSDGIKNKVVSTLALFPPFFHFSGDATQAIAIRNLYDQATYGPLTMWVGSRMYRGDDIYLLDWWPLDNQNTIGGGLGVALPPTSWGETSIAAHAGMERLDSSSQFEQVPVVAPFGVGTTAVTVLDRPRMTETLKLTQLVRTTKEAHPFDDERRGFKVVLYGEAQQMSAGVYQDTSTSTANPTLTRYPSETGVLVGGELAYWTGERDTFIQVFGRYAHGLAAYDPLAEPTVVDINRTADGASEALVAVGGNYEAGPFGLLYAAYYRYFNAGDPQATSITTYDEGTVDVRPQLFIGEHWGLALDGSFQSRRYAYLDPATNAPLTASEWRGGVMPYFSPSGRGSYKRPQLRLVYAVTSRNQGARELYAAQDPFSQRSVEHYLGLGVEWWFNSSSYP